CARTSRVERIRGWVDIDERLAGPEEVLEAVRGVMDAHLEQTERELLERLAAERATDGRAAEGVEAVLPALVEQKVETLLVREGAEAPGVKCVTCGWMGRRASSAARSTTPRSTRWRTSSSPRSRARCSSRPAS